VADENSENSDICAGSSAGSSSLGPRHRAVRQRVPRGGRADGRPPLVGTAAAARASTAATSAAHSSSEAMTRTGSMRTVTGSAVSPGL